MKCPFCGGEMTLGCIQCRDGLDWTPKKFPVAALSCFSPGRVSLANIPDQSSRAVHAHNCFSCKKVIIDYQQAE